MAIQHISPENLQLQLLDNPEAYLLLDVREPFEVKVASLANSVHIPMNQIPKHLVELEKDRATVVICHHGMRSESVAFYLDQQGYTQIYNLTGGIDAWARACDSEMVLY